MAVKSSCAIWILTALFTGLRRKFFIDALQKMWRKALIQVDIQRMKTGHYPSEKIKR